MPAVSGGYFSTTTVLLRLVMSKEGYSFRHEGEHKLVNPQ